MYTPVPTARPLDSTMGMRIIDGNSNGNSRFELHHMVESECMMFSFVSFVNKKMIDYHSSEHHLGLS